MLAEAAEAMTELASSVGTEAMGRHVLTNLAPILLPSAVREGGKEATASLQGLADALADGCSLADLPRAELRDLAEGSADQNRDAAGCEATMDELAICLGRSYHALRSRTP